MPPVVTLLTDFGTADSYVAEMKAALLGIVPHATLVDVTHEVAPGDVRAALYLLDRSWRHFAPGTVHLTVVDPGVGTARRALAAAARQHFFVVPDNGLLTPLLEGARVVELPVPASASATFHGRDVLAPAAGRLANGEPLAALGRPVEDAHRIPLPAPRRDGEVVLGEVIYVDRFGTLVTNIPADTLPPVRSVLAAGHGAAWGRTFGDVPAGALVAYPGSGGTVEVALRNGSASKAVGMGVGAEIRVLTVRGKK